MNWDDYRKAVDALSFSADFQERTEDLLRQSSKKEYGIMKKRKLIQRIAAIAAVIGLLTVSAYAAVRLMSPKEVAEFAGKPLLAQAFDSADAVIVNESAETGEFRVTLAGLVSGRGLDEWEGSVDQDRTYAVITLERLDGQPLANPDFPFGDYTITPLVSGYTPWSVNNWTLNAGLDGMDRDGVYYYLLDTQSLEMFADHTVYLAFYQGGMPSRELFQMNEDGTIAFTGNTAQPHVLFTLPLDRSKADPAAVEAFIAESGFDREWFLGTAEPETENTEKDGWNLSDQITGDSILVETE